jgi:hypothetical protein
MSPDERRRHPRSAPPGSDVALLVTERLVAHGRILDVSLGGARVRLDRGTTEAVLGALRESLEHGNRVHLVDDGTAGSRRVRIVWLGSLPDGDSALGLEIDPEASRLHPPGGAET